MMKHLYQLFLHLVICHFGIAQTKTIDLIWQMDTSDYALERSLPGSYQGEIKQMPKNLLHYEKSTLFSYPISIGNEKIYLNCHLSVSSNSVQLAIDKNFDSVFQETEIYKYTLDQYKNENFVINFSVKINDSMEWFFLLSSIKKTSTRINTPDSLLYVNPLYLQSKNFLRSSFMSNDAMIHLILMNTFPAMGNDRNFKYLVTNKRIDDSVFSKISNWSQSTDTILINDQQAIVSILNSKGGIDFSIIDRKNLFGTLKGSKMPKITVSNIDNSIVQLPIIQPGKFHLIEFWGTWCVPCTALYPRLDSLLKANAQMLSYTGITGSDDKEKVRRYISNKPTIHNQVFEPDHNKSIISIFKIHAYPTFILVDDRGIIVARRSGPPGLDIVEELINEAQAKGMESPQSN